MSEPYKHTRWTNLGDMIAQLKIARDNGLRIINAERMLMFHGLGLFGTDEQMRSTEAAWEEAGILFVRTRPKGAREVPLDTPSWGWAETVANWDELYKRIKS